MKNIVYLPCLILFTVLFGFSAANTSNALADQEPSSPLEIAEKLSDRLGQLSSLSFAFTQRTMGQISGRTKQASGHAYFAKDEGKTRMRWNYQVPDLQVIISDGNELIMYFENLSQMIIAPADTLQQDVTYSFFTGAKEIEENFIVSDGGSIEENADTLPLYDVIRLEPRSLDSQVRDIRLWVKESKHIQRIEITDNFETKTIINISNIKENSLTSEGKLINRELFRFSPPAGTEIIRQ